MSRRDNIRRAKEIIAARRAESISSYEKNTAEISRKLPEYADIDKSLSLTGSKIMAAALGKNDVECKLEEIKKEYEYLAAKKSEILINNGYPEDYCDIKYHCPICSDTGYVGIEICGCLKQEIIKASLESSGLYSLVKSQTFESFSLDYYEKDDKILMTRNVELLKNFSYNFVPGKSDSFLFLGATGLGKTHLSSAVATRVIEGGAYVVYESALKLFGDYEAKRFGNAGYYSESDEDTDRYLECDLLIIDDIGCEMTNQFTVSCLYNIINTRMLRHLSTIISTNLTQTDLRKRYSDRIVSRLFGEYKPLIFRGSDIREQKIRNSFNNK
ncbi:MAG: hypothetical protein E7672_06885 [Ruminococcaceae bacterium]|nr:hypothetical protein [Oscillospiraceae bacterium]